VDWAHFLERLSSKIGGLPLLEVAASHKENLEALEEILNKGKQFSGLAHEHLSYLLKVAREGLALRGQPVTWLDNVGWPKQEDLRLVVNWSTAPPNIRTAWSRVTRVDNLIRTGAPTSAVMDVAKSLF
jgi:hypothetical protein